MANNNEPLVAQVKINYSILVGAVALLLTLGGIVASVTTKATAADVEIRNIKEQHAHFVAREEVAERLHHIDQSIEEIKTDMRELRNKK